MNKHRQYEKSKRYTVQSKITGRDQQLNFILFDSTLSDYAQARHTRREAGIQCHGWQAQIHPWSLDSGNSCRNDDFGRCDDEMN